MADNNLGRLIDAAELLRPVLGELVFVGGTTAGLLVTDTAAGQPRSTIDVDAIVGTRTYLEHTRFEQRLRELGFQPDAREGAPLCRWVQGKIVLDVMPLDPSALGFSNRWYGLAVETAESALILHDLTIRIVSAPLFVATKIEAFKGRGHGDYWSSHDLGDLIALIDGRATLSAEIRAQQEDLREYVREEIRRLLSDTRFIDALPGFLLPDAASQARIILVLERLNELANLPVQMNEYQQVESMVESERVLLLAHQPKFQSPSIRRECQRALDDVKNAELALKVAEANSNPLFLRVSRAFLRIATDIRKRITQYGYDAIAVPDDLV